MLFYTSSMQKSTMKYDSKAPPDTLFNWFFLFFLVKSLLPPTFCMTLLNKKLLNLPKIKQQTRVCSCFGFLFVNLYTMPAIVQPFPKETQLFSMDFSWGPGSGSCNLGSCITPNSLVYTLLQKKGNFRNVAFLLEKTVTAASWLLASSWSCKPGIITDILTFLLQSSCFS